MTQKLDVRQNNMKVILICMAKTDKIKTNKCVTQRRNSFFLWNHMNYFSKRTVVDMRLQWTNNTHDRKHVCAETCVQDLLKRGDTIFPSALNFPDCSQHLRTMHTQHRSVDYSSGTVWLFKSIIPMWNKCKCVVSCIPTWHANDLENSSNSVIIYTTAAAENTVGL